MEVARSQTDELQRFGRGAESHTIARIELTKLSAIDGHDDLSAVAHDEIELLVGAEHE